MRPITGTGLTSSPQWGLFCLTREDRKVKTLIIALSAAALIAAVPSVFARGAAGKTSDLQHKVVKQHRRGFSDGAPLRETQASMQARTLKRGYAGALGYAPVEPRGLNRDLEASRQAGGGGGGGGGGGM
jgi:hypothetical protein